MLSILIPTYNYPVWELVENLHSQASKLNEDIEILIYEDGSDRFLQDNEKISSLENVFYRQNKTNIGRTALRTLLAKEAKNEFLLFLDSDVLPKNQDFIQRYLDLIPTAPDVAFGGIAYDELPPRKDKILRWKYGRKREAKSVEMRKKSPFFIISQNLFIRKKVFLKANDLNENLYGLDNYFSFRLKQLDAVVVHIHNPVIHRGLESSEVFLSKALEAVKTTVLLENRNLMSDDMRPLQKSYLKLKKFGLSSIFSFFISLYKPLMEKNFHSENPNLFWFDLYRLSYYIQLKRKSND